MMTTLICEIKSRRKSLVVTLYMLCFFKRKAVLIHGGRLVEYAVDFTHFSW